MGTESGGAKPQTSYTFRRATAQDLPSLELLVRETGFSGWPQSALAHELRRPHTLSLVAAEAEQVVGVVLAWLLPPTAEILLLAVRREHRSRGLARRLLAGLEGTALRRDLDFIVLEVGENNRPARSLYAQRGYHEAGRRHHYYRGDETALILKKALRPDGHLSAELGDSNPHEKPAAEGSDASASACSKDAAY